VNRGDELTILGRKQDWDTIGDPDCDDARRVVADERVALLPVLERLIAVHFVHDRTVHLVHPASRATRATDGLE
jgi:hypothetical protein